MKKITVFLAVFMLFSCFAAVAAEADGWRDESTWSVIKPGEGMYAAYDVNAQKWGYLRHDGKEVILPIYSKANSMREGLALAAYATPSGEMLRYIDASGKTVINLSSAYPGAAAGDFSDSLAPVYPTGGGKTVFIDKLGNAVLEYPGYASGFSEGLSPVYKDGLYGYIDKAGKMAINPQFEEASKFNDGYALVKNGGKYGVIGKDGKYIIEPKFEDVWMVDTAYSRKVFANGLMVVKYGGKWGAVTPRGEFKIPAQYDLMYCYQGGYAAVSAGGKWGLIDTEGKLAVNIVCEDITNAVNGYIFIKQNGAYSLYSLADRKEIPMDTSGITYVSSFDWENGSFLYKKNGFSGLIRTPSRPSDWSRAEIEEAIAAGLIPEQLRSNYASPITRADFCRLAVNLIENETKMNIFTYLSANGYTLKEDAFPDTSDRILLSAYTLGIITGRPDGTFGPEEFISRQEAAAMLARTARILNSKDPPGKAITFADRNEISAWSIDYVNYVSAAGVMSGNTKNEFMPAANYLREQSYVTFIRLYKALREF